MRVSNITVEYDAIPPYVRGDDVQFLRRRLEDYLKENNFRVKGNEIYFGDSSVAIGKIEGEWHERVKVIFGSRGAEKLKRVLRAYKLPEESELAAKRQTFQ